MDINDVFGGSSATGTGDGVGTAPPSPPANGGMGVTGAPPAPTPPAAPVQAPVSAPVPADAFARERAGFLAALANERQARQAAERRLQQPPAAPASRAPSPARTDAMPERADYANVDDYVHDYATWAAEQAVGSRMRDYEQQQTRRAEQQKQEVAEREFQTRMLTAVSAGEQKYPDFTPVINSGLAPLLNLSPMLHEALIDLGSTTHDVAYHLAKDPGEALRLAQITNMRQLDRELAHLEMRITSAPSPSPAPAIAPALAIPRTLTQQRDAKGQFAAPGAAYDGPTPLSEIFDRKVS